MLEAHRRPPREVSSLLEPGDGDEVSVQMMEVCGLGIAIKVTAGQMLEVCRTHSYFAPELLEGPGCPRLPMDTQSLSILIYSMVAGLTRHRALQICTS